MGQSLVQNYVHIVFGTKGRVALITPSIETELHRYLGGICNQLDCPVLIVGGFTDHIHILCMLSKNIALVKLVELLKSHSSKWIKTKGSAFDNFYWQVGYGGFSVSRGHIERVTKYIANQHGHHQQQTFQQEYRSLLVEHMVQYDERFVWD